VAIAVTAAVATVAKLVGIKTEGNPISMRYFARTGTYSIEKARRVLGCEPKIDLDEGMARTQKWLAGHYLRSPIGIWQRRSCPILYSQTL
jgi:nucleoside-diphosphate-sugar epimerase